jgi:hypothetical protein
MKLTKHTNWNYSHCECWDTFDDPEIRNNQLKKLHEEYVYFQSYVRDLLQSLDAEQQLKNGFKGMGHNILTETSGRKNGHIRKLKEMLGEE